MKLTESAKLRLIRQGKRYIAKLQAKHDASDDYSTRNRLMASIQAEQQAIDALAAR